MSNRSIVSLISPRATHAKYFSHTIPHPRRFGKPTKQINLLLLPIVSIIGFLVVGCQLNIGGSSSNINAPCFFPQNPQATNFQLTAASQQPDIVVKILNKCADNHRLFATTDVNWIVIKRGAQETVPGNDSFPLTFNLNPTYLSGSNNSPSLGIATGKITVYQDDTTTAGNIRLVLNVTLQ